MRFSVVHNVLKQELIWLGSFEKSLLFLLVPFVFVSFTLKTVIYDEQKCQVVRRFTAVIQLERLMAKYHIFNSLI